ncbi:MAG: GNAT family N-acetyltransferase [Clostridia bacterium]|nr:GNAT family N-acetyltransferase [Clostridia bacterium]
MSIEIKLITRDDQADINIKNEPFKLYGMMKPSYIGGAWSYEVELVPENEISEMTFPDENYSFDAMSKEHIFVGAYDGAKCVGLAILRHSWNRYLYLYDLKVNSAVRGQGVGKRLIEASAEIARKHGYRGISTQAQDNNLAACFFYIKTGFVIGGIDTLVYNGTKQEGKSDILFYRDN